MGEALNARGLALVALLSLGMIPGCAGPEGEKQGPAHEAGAHSQGHVDESEEGVVRLEPEAVQESGIEAGVAGPRRIEVQIETPGEVRMNAERVVEVRPRFPGVVRTLGKALGQHVAKGDVVASVHSNESLSEYAILAPLSGTVVAREASVGQAVEHDDRLYTIADLSSVWVDFAIYPQNVGVVRRGQRVRVVSQAGPGLRAEGRITYVGPLLEQDTRVSYARVVLPNTDGKWQPGLYVSALIIVSEADVPVAVPEEAIVRMEDGPAVFRVQGGTFRAQPVVTGRSDGAFTEIVRGLAAGDAIVVKNAFLLKAELGKSEAGHDH
jgi:cobalt-zinc-cadmium efflux system membrane fusion protein